MEARVQSTIGVASFITSVISGVLIFFALVGMSVLDQSTPGGLHAIPRVEAVFVVLGLVLYGSACVALGLGFGGIARKEHKRSLAVAGTIISATILASVVLLMVVGLSKVL